MLSKKKLINRIIFTAFIAFVIVWFYPHRNVNQLVYEEGKPWNYAQLIAPFDIPIHPDSATIKAARDTLDARFIPIYTINELVVDTIVGNLTDIPGTQFRDRLSRLIKQQYKNGVVSASDKDKIRSGRMPKIRILNGKVLSEEPTSAYVSPREIYSRIDSTIKDSVFRQYFFRSNLAEILRPNIVFNATESERYYDNEYQTLTADRGVILQGQAIINKGDIVSSQDFINIRTYEQILEQQEDNNDDSILLNWIGQSIYVVILLTILLSYFLMVEPEVFTKMKPFVFVMCLVALFFLISIGLSEFVPSGAYLVPLTIVPILVVVFFNSRTAFYVDVVTILLIAPVTTFALEYIFLQICAGIVAIYSLKELSRRSQLLRTASICAGTYLLSYLALELLMNGSFDGWSWTMVIFLMASSAMVSMAYIFMFAVEKIFGFVSVVTLSELADTNHPLLRKLSDTCPGTFQHCMAVSNLATDAARAMGANESLVRAGALYHDIGKLANPAFFTENQHGVNPHDSLTPKQSARIIIDHVTDGLKAADRAGLPEIIKDFIREHHGAGKAKYFYFQACKNAPEDEQPDPQDFTYPGPNPHSRESSLLMMADTVEAASRSLKDYSQESITNLVDKLIDGQISEGLHNNSALEFRDIPVIKEAFIKRLMTMYHTRIAYPDGK